VRSGRLHTVIARMLASCVPQRTLPSQLSAVGDARSVIRAGFQYHVAKPVGIRELVDVVANLALKEQPSGRLVD
jgi:hypothetical protein